MILFQMGAQDETFTLKWNDFHTSVIATFSDLRDEKNLCDVTIVCDGEYFPAHKLVLSACSGVFSKLFKRNKHQPNLEQLIMIWDIPVEEMTTLLNFMYCGEVNVSESKLNDFLAAADKLEVRGLYHPQGPSRRLKPLKPMEEPPLPRPTLPQLPKNRRSGSVVPASAPIPALIPSSKIVPTRVKTPATKKIRIKAELKAEEKISEEDQIEIHAPLHIDPVDSDTEDPLTTGDGEMGIDEDMELEEDFEDTLEPGGDPDTDESQGRFAAYNHKKSKELQCGYCHKTYKARGILNRHVSDCHETGVYPCKLCGKVFPSPLRMKDHVNRGRCPVQKHGKN